MAENIQKLKEDFERTKVRYDALNYMLSALIRSALIELLALDKREIKFDKECSFGTVYTTLHKVHIEGIHFDEHGGAIIECLDTGNQLTTCHINDMKFTTDEKYQFLNELMKHTSNQQTTIKKGGGYGKKVSPLREVNRDMQKELERRQVRSYGQDTGNL